MAVSDWYGMSDYNRETAVLAGAFGYGYGNRNDPVYYAASQAIIWDLVHESVNWRVNADGVNRAKNEILSDVAAYRRSPSFVIRDTVSGNSVTADFYDNAVVKRVYQVTDQNNVLSSMQMNTPDHLQVSQLNGNTFNISTDEINVKGSVSFTNSFSNESYGTVPIILYGTSGEAQKLIVSGNAAPRSYTVSLRASDIPVRVEKENDAHEKQSDVSFNVLDEAGNVVDSFVTDSSAHETILHAGNQYTYDETDAPDGYYCRKFTVTAPDTITDDAIRLINDSHIHYEVIKKDEEGNPVIGAALALYDTTNGDAQLTAMDDDQGNPWITDGSPRDISKYLHVNHSYALVEQNVSTKYFLAEDLSFTVSRYAPEGNPMIDLSVVDNHITYRFAKVDENGNPVEDAELRIYDRDDHDREVYFFTTGKEPTEVGLLERGHTYVLKETATPEGKYTMQEITFKVPDSHSADPIVISAADENIVYYALKTDEKDQPLQGAQMEVHDVTGGSDRIIQKFISNGEPVRLQGMIINHAYLLREVKTPKGYHTMQDMHFTIPSHGTAEPVILKAVDHAIALSVMKTDTDGHSLADIVLSIREKGSDQILKQWKTKPDTPEECGNLLEAGHTYILKEEESVAGYYKSTDLEFTVDEYDPTPVSITMRDEAIHISVLKEDETGMHLENAVITLTDQKDGSVKDSWTSVTEAHDISSLVEAGHSYVLREEESPNGYYQAVEQEFTVSEEAPEDEQMITLHMVDEGIRYAIAKVDEKSQPVAGVTLKLTDCDENRPVREWMTDEKPAEFVHELIAGHTYLLEETEWINGVQKAADMQFTVPERGNAEFTLINLLDETVALSILKTDEKMRPLAGAHLSIIDEEGNTVCECISTDEAKGVSQDTEGREISALLKGGSSYILRETETPFGYEKADDVHFTVTGTLARPQMIAMSDQPRMIYIKVRKNQTGKEDKLLFGAVFKLYSSENDQVLRNAEGQEMTLTTDENGMAAIAVPYMREGMYLKETKAPKGYQLDRTRHAILPSEDAGFLEEKPLIIRVEDQIRRVPDTSDQTDSGWLEIMLAALLIAAAGLYTNHQLRK